MLLDHALHFKYENENNFISFCDADHHGHDLKRVLFPQK